MSKIYIWFKLNLVGLLLMKLQHVQVETDKFYWLNEDMEIDAKSNLIKESHEWA